MQANTGHNQNNSQSNQGAQKSSLSWSQPVVPPTPAVIPTQPKPSVVVTSEKSHTGTYVALLVGGIIIGVLVGWGITRPHDKDTGATSMATSTEMADTNDSTTNPMTATLTPSSNTSASGAFTVVSPQTAGFAVAASNVLVSQPTWVVVYEDRAGSPGNALGAALFLPQSQGTAQSGTVELLRGTLPGQSYLAGEALDDGDKIFSLQNDKPVRDSNGNPVLVQFTTH